MNEEKSVENLKVLIRNLRKNKYAKLVIKTANAGIRYRQICKSIRVFESLQSDHSRRQ